MSVLCPAAAIWAIMFIVVCHHHPAPTVHGSLTQSMSMFRHRTSFYDMLRLRARLVRDSSRNVTAALMYLNRDSLAANSNGVSPKPIVTTTTTTTTTTSPEVTNNDYDATMPLDEEKPNVLIIEDTSETETPPTVSAHHRRVPPFPFLGHNLWRHDQNDYICGRQNGGTAAAPSLESTSGTTQTPTSGPSTRASRIVGGHAVMAGEFPWMVSLLLRGRHYCGAVIIDRDWLLTAAHCVYGHDASQFTALVGSIFSVASSSTAATGAMASSTSTTTTTTTSTSTTTAKPILQTQNKDRNDLFQDQQQQHFDADADDGSEFEGGEHLYWPGDGSVTSSMAGSYGSPFMLVKIERLIVHENFTRTEFFRNDIALIKLSEKIPYNDFIWPVCLPSISSRIQASNNNNNKNTDPADSNRIIKLYPPSSTFSQSPSPSPLAKHQRMVDDDNDTGKDVWNSSAKLLPVVARSSGIVVGWGSVERHGDTGATRRFLQALNRIRNITANGPGRWKLESINSADDLLQLRKVELPFIDRFTCERWYASRSRPIQLIERQFCAGLFEGGKDACRGDSGGPMLERVVTYDQAGKRRKEQYQVVGIVSAGIGCALPKLPGIYTRVESYVDWIEQNINQYEQQEPKNQTTRESIELRGPISATATDQFDFDIDNGTMIDPAELDPDFGWD